MAMHLLRSRKFDLIICCCMDLENNEEYQPQLLARHNRMVSLSYPVKVGEGLIQLRVCQEAWLCCDDAPDHDVVHGQQELDIHACILDHLPSQRATRPEPVCKRKGKGDQMDGTRCKSGPRCKGGPFDQTFMTGSPAW